jgi:hypothetical protein
MEKIVVGWEGEGEGEGEGIHVYHVWCKQQRCE